MIDDRRKPSTPPPSDNASVEILAGEASISTTRRRASRRLRVPNDPVPRPAAEGASNGAPAPALPPAPPGETAAPESPIARAPAPISSPPRPRWVPPPAGLVPRPRWVPPPPPASPVPAPPSTPDAAPAPAPADEGVVVRQVRRKIRAVGTGDAPEPPRPLAIKATAPEISTAENTEEIESPVVRVSSVVPIESAEDDFVVPPVEAVARTTEALRAPPVPSLSVPPVEGEDTVEVAIEEADAAADLVAGSLESITDDEVLDEPTEEIFIPEESQGRPAPRRSVPPPAPTALRAPTADGAVRPPPPPAPKKPEPPAPPAARPTSEEPARRKPRAWWEQVFNDDFLRTLPKYSPAQLASEGDFIETSLGVEKGAVVLDVGCGVGRQAIELATRGYEVIALDLSLPMLSRAADYAQERGAKLNFLHSDMREMEFNEMFDAAYCINTSFGFFDEDGNADVIQRIFRALKPGGTLLLDVHNRDYALGCTPSMAWYEAEGCVCMEETSFNYIKSRLEVKRTLLLDDGRQREIAYSIRLYSLHELGKMLHHAGFRIVEVSGSPRTPGAFFGPASRQLIILAQKPTGAPEPPR